MVMGPTHSLSGATLALAGITTYNASIAAVPLHPTVAILGTVMAAGAALAPDIDSKQSTVVRSFGIFGLVGYHIANGISIAVHNITATRKDGAVENGHRTFFHTTFMAILIGGLVALLTSFTNPVTLFGEEHPLGQVIAVALMGVFLNLAMAGLLEKRIKKARATYGPYLLMAFSFGVAAVIAYFLPTAEQAGGTETYAWLGIAVGAGWFFHLLGDAITKMGVPLAWPVKVRGKRWYDVALPSFMRITAGGAVEKTLLFPILVVATVGLFAWNIWQYVGVFVA